jgi:hypothetical protein
MAAWQPQFVNMASQYTLAESRKHLRDNMRVFGASEADITMSHEAESYQYEQPTIMCRYTLNLHTYLGWKVYMLQTGCFASKPEFEERNV